MYYVMSESVFLDFSSLPIIKNKSIMLYHNLKSFSLVLLIYNLKDVRSLLSSILSIAFNLWKTFTRPLFVDSEMISVKGCKLQVSTANFTRSFYYCQRRRYWTDHWQCQPWHRRRMTPNPISSSATFCNRVVCYEVWNANIILRTLPHKQKPDY